MTRTLLALVFGALPTVPAPGTSAPASACAVAVASDPDGAKVYLDGAFQGQTPLRVVRLEAGRHRLRVVKDGYLEHGRLVSVQSGETATVQVRLTPDPSSARAAIQVEEAPPKKTGGGGSKKLLIGLGILGAGAATYLLLPKNQPPVAAFSVDAGGTAGIASVTPVSFNGAGSRDPDGDALSFSWEFGDGATGSGQTTTHVYETAGSFNATLTVSDGKKQASATSSVTIRSLSGTWRGTWSTGGSFTIVLNQASAALSGFFTNNAGGSSTMNGNITAPRSVGWRYASFCDVWTGTVNTDVSQISGTTTGCVTIPYTMNRQ